MLFVRQLESLENLAVLVLAHFALNPNSHFNRPTMPYSLDNRLVVGVDLTPVFRTFKLFIMRTFCLAAGPLSRVAQTYQKLAELRADILVTHEAPSVHRFGFDALDALGKILQVSQSFHGHHHDCLDYRKHDERLGFAAYGVGFCGIMDDTGKTIWTGKYDHLRLRGGN